MLRREPDLEYLLATVDKAGTPIDPQLYRSQVETAFRRAGNEWGAEVSAHHYSYTINRVFDILKAFEEKQADQVLTFYRMFVEYLIEQRNRQCYEEASRCLVKLRTLYQKLGKNEAWTSYIADLREKNRNLRALREVMAKAGL